MSPTPAVPPPPGLSPRESSLRSRNEALALALEAAHTAMWDYDVPANCVTLDPNWSRMLGGPPTATAAPIREVFALIHPDDRKRASAASFACLSGRTEEYSEEYRVRDHRGEWVWVHSRGRVTARDSRGRARRMIGTNIDVTQRKNTELAASRQAEFLQALNQTTLAMLQRQAKAEVLHALAGRAAGLLDAVQVEVSLLQGETLVTHASNGGAPLPGSERAGRAAAPLSWRALDSRQPAIVEDYAALADPASAYRQARFTAVAVFPILLGPERLGVLAFARQRPDHPFNAEDREKGQLLAQLAALVIHNASVYEDAVRMAEARMQAVRESEARFRSIFDSSPIPIVLLAGAGGQIREINKAGLETFGYTRGEVVGRNTQELGSWADATERDRILHLLRTDGFVRDHETQMRGKDGRMLHVHYNACNIAIGNESFLLSFVIDITGQKQAEAALRKSEAQLRQAQKMESLGTLAGGIAHDFNNILTGILGFAQLSRADIAPDHPAAQWLDGILASGERAKGLVQQILTFSRKAESERSPLRLQLVARESLNLLRSTLPAMVRLEHRLDPACPPVLADPTEIHQIILNLCTNAWHALPEAGGLIEVTLAPREVEAAFAAEHPPLQPGPHVVLAVRDDGKGMSAATQERIFEPFFTTKEAGKGTGLGLAVVHSVVTAHGGAILLDSAPGRGALFQIFLPALAAAAPPPASIAPAALPKGRGEAILVVDDDSASGSVIARLIERLGYHPTLCADPLQAIALLYANDYAMLVTDLAMPGLPGDELARQALVRRPGLPVLLLSGFIEPGKLTQLRQDGVREVLGKPPSLDDLAAALQRCLQG